MHILYLIDELIKRAGTEKHLLALAGGMVSRGHRVTVVSWVDGPFAASFKSIKQLNYRCLEARRIYDLKGLVAIGNLTAYIRKEKVDILQSFHTGSDIVGPIAALLSRRTISVVSSRRDLGFTKSKRHLRVQRILNWRVNAILANSIAVKGAVREQEGYPTKKIDLIYNGIDLSLFHENKPVPEFLLPITSRFKEPCIIGTLGNLKEHKGHGFLIDVFARVARCIPKAVLAVAGEGPFLKDLQHKCALLGVNDRVFFLGSVTDVAGFLKNIHLFVHPSASEGLSNAIIEAMAAGCAIIATNAGGNRDMVKENINGFIVDYGAYDLMATKIIHLLKNDKLRTDFGLVSKTLSENYCIEKMLTSYNKFYYRIVQ